MDKTKIQALLCFNIDLAIKEIKDHFNLYSRFDNEVKILINTLDVIACNGECLAIVVNLNKRVYG